MSNNILISQLANHILLMRLIIIDRFILNEQIHELMYLNYNTGFRPGAELNIYYLDYIKWWEKNNTIDKNIPKLTEDQFQAFLLVNGLITQNMNGFAITPFGQDYLAFALRIKRPLDKSNNQNKENNVPNDEKNKI